MQVIVEDDGAGSARRSATSVPPLGTSVSRCLKACPGQIGGSSGDRVQSRRGHWGRTGGADTMIRVLIADDHGVVRDGLGRLLEATEDIELVGAVSDGEEAVERARELRPDVVLMDLDMPNLDGVEATRRNVAEQTDAAVLVLTSFSDRPRILGAIEAGAAGYLLKDASSEEVTEGIRTAARGESPLDPRAARTVLDARSEPDPLAAFSARELEVLTLLAEGLPEQADRSPAGDQREDGQGPPHPNLPRDWRQRSHPGRALGRASRSRLERLGPSPDQSPIAGGTTDARQCMVDAEPSDRIHLKWVPRRPFTCLAALLGGRPRFALFCRCRPRLRSRGFGLPAPVGVVRAPK